MLLRSIHAMRVVGINKLKQQVGERIMERDVLTEAMKSHPFARRLLDK